MTLKQLAEATGYSASTISEVEHSQHRPSGRYLRDMRIALGLSERWMADGTGEMFSSSGGSAALLIRDRLAFLSAEINDLNGILQEFEDGLVLSRNRSAALLKGVAEIDDLLRVIKETGKEHLNAAKDNLDTSGGGGILGGVKFEVPSWSELKKEIASLTKEHGQRSALAAELGVSRQAFGNWITADDQGAPNAELTLRLFKWVLDHRKPQKK